MKTILLAVLGRSPQIVTETLYYLTQIRRESVDEIQILTTQVGREEFMTKLTDNGRGHFYRFCQEYGLNSMDLNLRKPAILVDRQGKELLDIRSNSENEAAANQIIEKIREVTALSDTRLFCSMAGGRKTMGVYASFAMQFFGRDFDRLYHVLIWPPELEGATDFYFPPKQPGEYVFHRGEEEIRLRSENIRIDLAEIPFIRLRGIISEKINLNLPFDQLVHYAQRVINESEKPTMILKPSQRQLLLKFSNDQTITVHLRPREIAVLAYLMEQRNPLLINEFDMERIGEIYGHFFQSREYDFKRVAENLKKASFEIIRELISRIRSSMRQHLQPHFGIEKYVAYYLPQTFGRQDPRYFIPLPKDHRIIQE